MSLYRRVAEGLLPPEVDLAAVFRDIGYEPTPKQWEFHQATEFDVLYGGAMGGAKTTALVLHAVAMALVWPGLRAAFIRRSYPELEESITPTLVRYGFFEDQGARYHQNNHELRFNNGSVIRSLYLENLVDAGRRQGGEYQLLCFDERTQLMPGIAEVMINERLRARVGSGVPVLGVRSTSNPGGASHNDVKARYIDATEYGKHPWIDPHGHSVRFIPAKVDDNPYVDPGYKANLDAIADPRRRAAMRDGSWDVVAGAMFAEWSRDRHIVPRFPLPAEWTKYCGVDWGYAAPWAVIWGAEDEDGRVWLYRELYDVEVGEAEQARRILAAEREGENPIRVCDPAMRARRGDAASIVDAYGAEGVHVEPAVNDRVAGWSRLHAYLAEAPACPHHRAQGWPTCPLLHVFEDACPNLCRTLPALPRSDRNPDDLETHTDDHCADATRYLLMSIGDGPQFHIYESAAGTPGAPGPDGEPLVVPYGPFGMYAEDTFERVAARFGAM